MSIETLREKYEKELRERWTPEGERSDGKIGLMFGWTCLACGHRHHVRESIAKTDTTIVKHCESCENNTLVVPVHFTEPSSSGIGAALDCGSEPRVDGYSPPSPEHIAWHKSLSRDPTTRGAICNGCGVAQQQCEFTHEWVLAHVGHRP